MPCSDGGPWPGLEAEERRHHVEVERLVERMLLKDPRTPPMFLILYEAERMRHADERKRLGCPAP